jgi:hypothetical protein
MYCGVGRTDIIGLYLDGYQTVSDLGIEGRTNM